MTATTLITGGAGFIGSHLAEHLLDLGHQVVLVDDLSTGRLSNIAPLLERDSDRCRLVEATAGEAIRDRAVTSGVTRIFHLAAAVGVKRVVDDPAGMVRTNIDETVAVLDAACDMAAAVLIASSSEVYGKCPVLPLREDMDLVYGPTTASRWSYGLTKALDEHLAMDYARRRGLRAVVARLFNTIGPRQIGRYGMVVPRFVSRALSDQPLEIYGDGCQTRAFCDVRDVVAALALLLDEQACYGRVFNVGSDRPITIEALADRVLALTGSRSSRRHVPYEAVYGEDFEDPPHRLPDLTRLRSAIGFRPRRGLDDTLRDVIEDKRGELVAATSTKSA